MGRFCIGMVPTRTSGTTTAGKINGEHIIVFSSWIFLAIKYSGEYIPRYEYQGSEGHLYMNSSVMPDDVHSEEWFRDYQFTSRTIEAMQSTTVIRCNKFFGSLRILFFIFLYCIDLTSKSDNNGNPQPFMVSIGYKLPHLAVHVPQKYFEMYRNLTGRSLRSHLSLSLLIYLYYKILFYFIYRCIYFEQARTAVSSFLAWSWISHRRTNLHIHEKWRQRKVVGNFCNRRY